MESILRKKNKDIAQRLRCLMEEYRHKERIKSVAEWCKRYGFGSSTVQNYLTNRVNIPFIEKFCEITGASLAYIVLNIGDPWAKNTILTKKEEYGKDDTISIPMVWEVSSFREEKLIKPAFYLRFPKIYPFTEIGGGKMAVLISDQNFEKAGVKRGDVVIVDFSQRKVVPGKTYLFSSPDLDGCNIKVMDKEPDPPITVSGRVMSVWSFK